MLLYELVIQSSVNASIQPFKIILDSFIVSLEKQLH